MASKSPPLLRLIQSATKIRDRKGKSQPKYTLQISCHVKPNASARRQGVLAVGPETVDIAVAAVPRDGESNAAVSKVLADVFDVSKSDVAIIRGHKSREKTLSISGLDIGGETEAAFLEKAKQRLSEAIVDGK
ncbi:hypothetical protein DTO195F2_5683 [Paecilomyces variotii]|nr:hypothetical protein DTO195F2_5683 [Paecilomyces variotii]KAJ9305819.1 hypothetical protein DTO217A2_4732 [Paecilomyces variotii]KAJ9351397.1 hypothetical protein DTO027B9_6434 [Paecilomyces variotii]KAJ9369844.1 hypothetical protein DTO282E5_5519 [Paecilomyces variotii]KAJ9399964.1 hypothetical protein DTO282F9_3034 [Paecilomyces variotii]